MASNSNCCNCFNTVAGTSNLDFTGHCTCNRYGCVPHCRDQYDFLCGRNYAVLRKICKKIFKEFIRSRCYEKYTLFDGGNSINIKVHRSRSHDAKNYRRNEKDLQNYGSKEGPNKIDLMSKHRKGKKESNKKGERKKEDNGLNHRAETRNKNDTRGRGRHEAESADSANDVATKPKLSSKKDENKNKYLEKGEINNDTQGKQKQRGRKSKTDDDDEFKAEKEKNKRSSVRGKKGSWGVRSDDVNNGERKEGDKDNLGKPSEVPKSRRNSRIINDLRLKVRRGENPRFDEESRKSKNFMSTQSRADVARPSGFDEFKADKEKSKTSSARGKKATSNVRSDKGNNGRSQKSDKSNMGEFLEGQKSRASTHIGNSLCLKASRAGKVPFDKEPGRYIKINRSRADEARSCDFLRAQMEERDFCKLCCQLKLVPSVTYVCNSKMCTTNFHPKNLNSCLAENCKC